MNRTTLQKLELQRLKLQSQEVISGIGRLRYLKYLNLAGVESLEDAALCGICSSCSALESLYVQSCPLLTDGALQALPSSLTCLWFSSTKVSLNLLLSYSTLLSPPPPSPPTPISGHQPHYQITAAGLSEVCSRCTDLVELSIAETAIEGAKILPLVAKFSSLKILYLPSGISYPYEPQVPLHCLTRNVFP